MKKKTILSRLRATLRGAWWRAQLALVRHCFACGGKLASRHVPEEGRRRLVCDACSRITYMNPKVVAGLVPVNPDGSVVLLRRDIEPARGKWTYPAGYQELGESVEDAARRETREEINADVEAPRLLGVYSYADAGVVTIVYVAKLAKGERASVGHEAQEVQSFLPEDIPWKELAFRSTTEALRLWVEGVKTTKRRRA